MLKLILSLTLILVAVSLWYCSTKHQRLLSKPLVRQWRFLAAISLLAALVCAAVQLSSSATLFFCLLLLMLLLMLLPFASLLLRGRHEPN
ncbi:MAG: hypothetical protein U5L02_01950 [Rheinheimera sp.]|nr:hypothetical protein [Rheinheimera sp.]